MSILFEGSTQMMLFSVLYLTTRLWREKMTHCSYNNNV